MDISLIGTNMVRASVSGTAASVTDSLPAASQSVNSSTANTENNPQEIGENNLPRYDTVTLSGANQESQGTVKLDFSPKLLSDLKNGVIGNKNVSIDEISAGKPVVATLGNFEEFGKIARLKNEYIKEYSAMIAKLQQGSIGRYEHPGESIIKSKKFITAFYNELKDSKPNAYRTFLSKDRVIDAIVNGDPKNIVYQLPEDFTINDWFNYMGDDWRDWVDDEQADILSKYL